MNKKFLIALSSLFLLPLAFGVNAFTNVQKTEATVGNYSTNSSTYYNDITATSGKQLAAQLHDLITSTHRQYTSYDDNGKYLYQQKTDQYYENGSKVNGYIYEFYSGVKWPNGWDPNAGKTTGGYNREHCWCQSNSVDASGTQMWGETGGGGDMHHLRPVEVRLNSTRSNNPYGEISDRDSHKVYAKFGTDSTYALGGYYNSGVFEPIDSKKGDVARIILYTYLHYNSKNVSDLFGSYATTNGNGSSSYFSSGLLSLTKIMSPNTEAKALELLLKWNTNDPVDDIERRRNEQVAIYQGNRNPFIDNQTYADAIWGTSSGITSISKTSTTITTGQTDTISAVSSNTGTISWSSSNTSVATVSSGSASSGSSITINAVRAGTANITASITISGITYSKSCAVTVSDPKTLSSIAATDMTTSFLVGDTFVFDGVVTTTYTDTTTAIVTPNCTFSGYDMSEAGEQTVTVSYTEGTLTKTTTYSISVSDTGGSFTGSYTYSNQGTGTGKTWSLTNCTDKSSYWLCPDGTNVTTSVALFPGIFTNKIVTSDIVITINNTTYGSGTNPSSNTFKIYNSSACTTQVTAAQSGTTATSSDSYVNTIYTVTEANAVNFSDDLAIKITKPGKQIRLKTVTIEFTYENVSAGPSIESITLDTSEVQKSFVVNSTFNYDGLIVTAHYSDETSEELDSYNVTTPDMSTTGTKTVTVSHSGASATYTISVTSAIPTSISASVDKTFYVGETITEEDITVVDNLGTEVAEFEFTITSYTFRYSDASSGGALTSKTFTNSITSGTFTCSLTVQVQRKARFTPTTSKTDTMNLSYTGASGSTYTSWTNKSGSSSSAKYAGNNAGNYSSIQLRSGTSNNSTVHSGIVTTTSPGNYGSVSVSWNSNTSEGRTLNIYGKNTAYTDQDDLYSSTSSTVGTLLGTIVYGTSTSLDITGNYAYIGVRVASNTAYLDSISFVVRSNDSAVNLSNYIMYEDTSDQCTTKFATAKGYFEGLSLSQRNVFMSSDDYVISTARERFEAWARNRGQTITYVNNDYVLSKVKVPMLEMIMTQDNSMILVVIITVISLGATVTCYYLRKKKRG